MSISSIIYVYLVDGVCWLHLHLAGRRVDTLRYLCLDGYQDATPVGHPLPQPLVQCGVLVHEAVVPRGAVQVHKGGPEGGQVACGPNKQL